MAMVTTLLVVVASVCIVNAWHPYNPLKEYTDCPDRNRFAGTGRVNKTLSDLYRLWPDVSSDDDTANGETMYGFEVGMEAIWRHQHPEDCSKVKYVISGGFESGFASEFHVIGAGLALAMKLNRVYVMMGSRGNSQLMDKLHSNNAFQIENEFCRNQGKPNLDCYYEPWSSCTMEDALHGTSLQELRLQGLYINFNDLSATPRNERTVIVHLAPELVDEIPPQLTPVVHCSPIEAHKHKYWWRALSAAYLLRPNEPTRQLIMQHRQDPEMRFDQDSQQCVSVHIRRGDKHLEMKIIEDETVFFETAQLLWDRLQNTSTTSATKLPSKRNKPIMFLGSEDPAAMDGAATWAKAHNWELRYTNLFDRKQVTTGLNNDEQQKARQMNAFKHHEWEYFNMILTLDGHMRCSAFVCTQRSNYCRVVDELRATVGNKAHLDYADFSCHGGPPPCINSPEIGIGW